MRLRESDRYVGTKCKYCAEIFLYDDDQAYHESKDHGDDLSDYTLVGSSFYLNDSPIAKRHLNKLADAN